MIIHGILCSKIVKEQARSLSMASGSNTDDEFDWEAAVAEIDDACNRAALATTSLNHNDTNYVQKPLDRRSKQRNESDIGKLPLRPTKVVRQSTLDKFVEVTEKYTEDHQSSYPNRTSKCDNNDELYNVDSVNSGIDPVAAKTWIYPVNIPLRDYQFSIVKTALFSNTLVSLPTGLGKTLIAAVVMYNYFRWFPAGKIVFTAPSRPLVIQQIEACHNIVGIPQEWTIDMTGQMNPAQRSGFWQSKRVFFVTPQVLEKDIQSSSCLVKQLVCLVVDEAHRAMGNYSYCVVVREIMEAPVQLRILALTATPGSKQATIQTVIDNLHISTMEYRNESDPDVSPYTHNRNIELIPVKLSKESVNISSRLLDVTKPVVEKLCSLGVFYNRDVTKLAPIEFLTARDKFRESPPAYLAQMQYGEVEACFGAGITLYHIYKLLFSHGIRPAFEMLQQKLQQGSFARLMGRNETLWQVKLLMQQSLGHGAPNPKVLKMEEIIINHFKSNDPGNSRVIIFTNFRESVKDIMESLAKLGDVVKAMEFIGQSSGKASKGQSQKVQQAVLQKFRAGGYNAIVATSIGEEGLDIMEVDLVICFDANVSPIRMIQRMGRTGRKRDGRVVILASEGSELQGYLKKQAKGKALGKHMHNGGINSFNFHCSPRMVPHSYQPEVQFVEMSIEKFVPRGRKSKADAVSADKEDGELTESEKNLLAKYFGSGTEEVWKPSLVAFPQYQLFPSQVYKVRHSFRTTVMLIDTLQFLQEYRTSLACSKTCFLRTEAGASSTACLPSVLDITREAGSQGVKADSPEPDDLVSEEHHIQLSSPSTQSGKVVSDSQQTFQEVNVSYRFCEADESLAKHKSLSDEALKHESSDSTVQDKEASLDASSSRKTSLHRCIYNTGFVSVNQDGRVIILSPPTLPVLNNLSSVITFMNGNNSVETGSEKPVSPPLKMGNSEHVECMTPKCSMKEKVSSEMANISTTPSNAKPVVSHEQMTPEQIKVCSHPNDLIHVIDSLERVSVSTPPRGQRNVTSYDVGADVQMSPFSGRSFEMPKEVVLETPDSCFQNFTHDFRENIFRHLSTADASCVDLSPHVANLAVRDIVPESPIAKTNSQRNVTSYDAGADVQIPPFSGRSFEMPKEVVISTPDSCLQNFTHDFRENIFRPLSIADASCVDLSPHVTNLAVRDIVLESPIAKTNSLQQPISNFAFNKTRSDCKSPACGIIASSFDEQVTYLRKKGINDLADYTNTEICKTPRENQFVIPADVSPAMVKSNKFELKSLTTKNCSPDNAEQLNFECPGISKPSTVKEKSTPLVTQMSNSCSEDWHLSTAETEISIQRQCKFKRLCKHKYDSEAEVSASPSPSQIPYTRIKKHHASNDSICRKSKLSKEKRHSKISARLFIDEEAEVSSDDDVSTDDDDECDNDINEGESESDSFIDDRVEPTAASTQSEGDQVDIMAVYRRSLFTQSPLADRFCQPQAYAGSGSPDPSESTNASVDNNIGSDIRSLSTSSTPTLIQDTDTKTSSSMGHYNVVEDSRIVDVKPSSSEERHGKMESRKRKLSFLQLDSTGKSNVLENQVPPFAVEKLGENFSRSSFKENESMGHTFDDDLFEGLDLDALEAEATEMARLRLNMNAGAGQMTSPAKSCLPNTHSLDLGCSVKPVSFLNNATSIEKPSRTSVETSVVDNCINGKVNKKDYKFAEGLKEKNQKSRNDVDLDFLCTPSFDLGI